MLDYIDKSYYIIKVSGKHNNAEFSLLKIGEEVNESRMNDLVEKYTHSKKGSNSIAVLLDNQKLPISGKRRLTDNELRNHLTKFVKVDRNLIEAYLDETDGYTEFFEFPSDMSDKEVIDYVSTIANSISTSKYTGQRKQNYSLSYDPTKYHLVNADLIEKIFSYLDYSFLNDIMYNNIDKNILLVGQFEHSYVNTWAARHNLYIWHDSKDQVYDDYPSFVKQRITYVDNLEQLLNMKFDLIISNPPYGKIGANITKNIIDNVEFDRFVNLLPANDYKRNDEHDLYNYQSDMISIKDGFKDAAVTTHLACIHNHKVNQLTVDQYQVSCFVDESLDKYFKQNIIRDLNDYCTEINVRWHANKYSNDNVFLFGWRDIANGHFPFAKDCATYKWNVERSISGIDLQNDYSKSKRSNSGLIECCFSGLQFNKCVDKDNFVNFLYSGSGFKFISKVFRSMDLDGGGSANLWFPKVDWSHSWTVEEILTDYGYTEVEIKEVMDDLVNFKGMKE